MNLSLSQRLLALVFAWLLSLGAYAQEVQWSHQVQVSPNSPEATVLLTATMEDGWHLYDMEVPEDGPQATVISFEGSVGVEPQGVIEASVESVKAEDSTYGIVIGAWEDTVTFTQRFKITSPTAVIKGKVTFMACDDRNCMPPQSYTFSCDVTRPDVCQAQVLKSLKDITANDIETCCCIGWSNKKK